MWTDVGAESAVAYCVLRPPHFSLRRRDRTETHLRPTAASEGRQHPVFTRPSRTIDTNYGYCRDDSITATLEKLIPQ
jgi:hypothetical protein